MCDCISYNMQVPGQAGTPEKVLPFRKYFPDAQRETVCVDACIAETIERLWAAGVLTVASCCGHNGTMPMPRPTVMLAGAEYAEAAALVLANDPRDWWVIFWA